MKTKLTICAALASLLLPGTLLAEAPKMTFEENKNQWPGQVMFQADISGGNLFLEKDKFTYLFMENVNFHDHTLREGPDAPVTVKYHSLKVNFENSNPDVEVLGNNLFSWHRNYYRGNDPSKWAENVKLYGEIYYKGLYPSVDLNVYNTEYHLKYDFIIQPGGSAESIRLSYEGPDEMRLEYGHLFIKTSVGTIIEQKPYAYQEVNGVKKEIRSAYVLKNNILSFYIGEYDPSLPLVIDPTLIASTYTGSTADNWGYTATYDDAGNIYTGGIAAANGYPTTAGAFQTTFQGGMPVNTAASSYPFDIVLTKFNSTGTALLFSTYYGGSLNEQPHSLMVNSSNQLFVVGRTNSTNFPTTAGVFSTANAGLYDIIVGKFNATGGLLASTYVGGSGDDCVNVSTAWNTFGTTKYNYADDGRSEIILDNNSNVYVAACTRSVNFPTSAGAIKTAIGGAQDAVVFKMNSTLTTLSSSTYLGGTNIDAAYGLKLDNSNNIYVTGGTNSTNFPTTAGVINVAAPGGTADGFIAVLNNACTSILRATYLGTIAYDQSYLIEIDAIGDVYVFGQTRGAYPVTAGVYTNANSAQFIHKLSGLLTSTIFSTVIGTGSLNPNLSPTAFLVDSCQSIYISGWGRCSSVASMPNLNTVTGMPITANAFQATTVNGCNFYFMVLTPNAKTLWYATFFGEQAAGAHDHVDGGTSRFDKRAFIYQSVCASCRPAGQPGGTQGWPTTPGAYSTTNNSVTPQSNCNNAVVKMDVQVKPIAVAAATSPQQGCAPLTVSFTNAGSTGASYVWDFGDGSPTSTSPMPSHTYSFAGTYTLTLYAVDSIGICGFDDQDTVIVLVGQPPVLTTSVTAIPCNNGVGSATVTPTGGLSPLTYSWSTTPAQTTAIATGLTAGTYTVTVRDALGCSATKTVTLTAPANVAGTTTTVPTSCGGSNGTATVNPTGGTPGYTFSWGTTPSQTTQTATGLSTGTYTVLVTDSNGCTRVRTATVTATPQPTVAATASQSGCTVANGTGTVTVSGGMPAYTYSWSNGQTTSVATGLAIGSYTITVTDAQGCSKITTVNVTATGQPSLTATSTQAGCTVANGTATANPSGGTPGYSYLWTPGNQTTATATGLAVGTYTIQITDSNGCPQTTTVSVTATGQPSVTATTTQAGCTVANGTATANPSGGTPGYSYSWTPGNQTTATATGLAVGSYTVLITDSNGCTQATTVSVTPTAQPAVTATSTVSGCTVAKGTATANPSGGTPGYSYFWTPGNQTTSTATGLATGSYTVLITDANGCTSATTVSVGQAAPPSATASASSNVSCFGFSNGAATVTPSGGLAPYTYSWGTTPAQTTANATGLANGTYTVIVRDANGCTATANVTITQPTVLVGAIASSTNANCNGGSTGSATATGSGGTPNYTYLWSPSGQTSPTATGLSAGTYSVLVTDSKGCTKTATVSITQPSALVLNANSSGTTCGNSPVGSASANGQGGTPPYAFTWSNGQTTASISNLASGTYSVTVTDGKGCTKTGTVNIVNGIQPLAAFIKDSAISCDGIKYTFTDGSSLATSLSWSLGDGTTSTQPTVVHVYPYNGTYQVYLIVTNPPCKDTAMATVKVGDMTDYAIVGPANIFTPNADAINDCFRPALIGPNADTLAQCISLVVYDRWGIKMFESNDAAHCWDGTIQKNGKPGDPAVDGTYYYIASLGKTKLNGFVTLIRKK